MKHLKVGIFITPKSGYVKVIVKLANFNTEFCVVFLFKTTYGPEHEMLVHILVSKCFMLGILTAQLL